MNISKNLKRLRLDKGLTQEDLASRIGVTGQAVSKWERDECYPDITLLPGLANCFGVTIDELLGMAEIQGKMWGVYAKANDLQKQRRYHDAVTVYDEALQSFPTDQGLITARAEALAMAGENTEQAIALLERRLQENLNDHYRGSLVAVLCFLYQSTDQTQKAELLARRRPHARDSRELLLPNFLPPAERNAYLREHVPGILTTLCHLLHGDIQSTEEHLRQTVLGTYEGLIPPAQAAALITDFLTQPKPPA